MSREEIAAAIGKSPVWVRDRVLLRQLSGAEQSEVREGRLPVTHALARVRSRMREEGQLPGPSPAARSRASHTTAKVHCDTCTCTSDGENPAAA